MKAILWAALALAESAPGAPPLSRLVTDGMLPDAERAIAAQPWRSQPAGAERLAACRLLLFRNMLGEAAACARTEAQHDPASPSPRRVLAEALARQGAWREAADAFTAAGAGPAATRAAAFAVAPPYRDLPRTTVSVAFERRDPLPVVKARIGDGPELYFLIDTGAADTVLDTRFATDPHVTRFASSTGTFAGDKTAAVGLGLVDALTIGGARIGRAPVNLLDTGRFAAAAGGLPISGVIGQGLLSHFLATIDYPASRLVLRPKESALPRSAAARSLRMWLAGDHYTLVEGALNGVPELAFVDTGLAGAACAAPGTSIEAAKLTPIDGTVAGTGGSGSVTARAYVVPSVSIGSATVDKALCLGGVFPPSLEHGLGTRVGLLVSHAALARYAVTFDYARMRLTLDPGANR